MAVNTQAPQWTPTGIEQGPVLDALQRLFAQNASLQSQVDAIPAPTAATPAAQQGHNVPYAIQGKPSNGQVVNAYTYTSTVNYPANFAGSQGTAVTAATANAQFTIWKNGVTVGYVTATPANGFVFTSTGPQTFNAGDSMVVTAPASADSTLADIHVNFAGAVS